jgi:parvulin-like peptidyl-prolyl isomerase
MNLPHSVSAFVGAWLLASAMTSVLAQETAATTSADTKEILVKGKDLVVMRGELDEAMSRHEREMINSGKLIHDDDRTEVLAGILDRIVFIRLVMARATDDEKKRGAEKAKLAVEDVRTRLGTDSAFKRLIQRAGLDEATFRSLKVEEQTVLLVLDREVKSQIRISDEAVAKYYNDQPEKFDRPEVIRAAHILVATRQNSGKEFPEETKKEKRKLAESLLERVRKGEDFAKLARQFSDDGGSRYNGGEVTLTRGQTFAEFETAAAALKPNEISNLVTSELGYHVIKGIELKAAGKVSLAEASKDIREFLVQKEFEKQVPAYTERLKKEAGIELAATAPKAKK